MNTNRDGGPTDTDADERPAARPERRVYVPPQLIEYGSVAKLTQGTLTTQSDGAKGGMKKKSCL